MIDDGKNFAQRYTEMQKRTAVAGAAAIAHYRDRLRALEHPYTFIAAITPTMAKNILERAIANERAAMIGESEDAA